jgi:lipopolysaccharide biosynthesis protein
VGSEKDSLRIRYKAFRKKLLALTPFIRRKRHERIVARVDRYLQLERKANESMGYLFFAPPRLATTARYVMRVPIRQPGTDELCLFVTHSPNRHLKPHVIDHVNALLDAGIAVILIANTDLDPSSLEISPEFAARLHGCMIRENVGYDFAAWAHAYSLIDPATIRRRLYLINDSIVGPLDGAAYQLLLQRVREAHADFVGLTCNPDSHEHLQSYFLVFNDRLLHSETYDRFMRGVFNLPSKQNVVDCYEIWLTPFLVQQGFKGFAVFPNLASDPPPRRNDTLYSWRQLIDAGFPFIKSSLLIEPATAEEARALLPSRYL